MPDSSGVSPNGRGRVGAIRSVLVGLLAMVLLGVALEGLPQMQPVTALANDCYMNHWRADAFRWVGGQRVHGWWVDDDCAGYPGPNSNVGAPGDSHAYRHYYLGADVRGCDGCGYVGSRYLSIHSRAWACGRLRYDRTQAGGGWAYAWAGPGWYDYGWVSGGDYNLG